MDAAHDPAEWHDLAVAVMGASAALAGLLVIALSINLQDILGQPGLPRRAAAALVTLTGPLFISVVVLVPDAADDVVGALLLVTAVIVGALLVRLDPVGNRGPSRTTTMWAYGSALPSALLVLPTALAGLGMVTGSLGGLYWLPIAVVAAFAGGLLQAWVLLVEILR